MLDIHFNNKYNFLRLLDDNPNYPIKRQIAAIGGDKTSQNIKKLYSNNYKSYCFPIISFTGKNDIDEEKLKTFGIPNYRYIGNNNVRGESLSSKKNRKYLYAIKNSGIKNVIDLRDKFTSKIYGKLCDNVGLNYFHIPIDSDSVSDNEIIKSMPLLFSVLNEGKTYIACAQGLHRTDIALAINYIFNPEKQQTPPVMYGHFRDFGFKSDDIFKRINSLKKYITENDIINIGWQNIQQFESAFDERKKELKQYNKEYVNKAVL